MDHFIQYRALSRCGRGITYQPVQIAIAVIMGNLLVSRPICKETCL